MNLGTSPLTTGQHKVARDRHSVRVSPRLRLSRHRSHVAQIDAWMTAISPDGQVIASCHGDRAVKLWNAETGKRVKTLIHQQPIWACDFSASGWGIATAGEDGMIWLWDLEAGRCFGKLQGHTACIRSLAFAPIDDIVASGSIDTTVRLWNVATGRCLTVFEGHNRPVHTVAFNSTGEFLATQSDDHQIKIWDLQTSQCLDTFTGYVDSSSDLWELIDALEFGGY